MVWLRHLDPLLHRLDRWARVGSRRSRALDESMDIERFAYELGRWVGPVAERCGYGPVQLNGMSAIHCGDPAVVLGRHPWVARGEGDGHAYDDPIACVDLQVEWRDGFVELRAEPFVRRSLLAPATDRGELASALEHLSSCLAEALDGQVVLEGTGPWDDPRRSEGSSSIVTWYAAD